MKKIMLVLSLGVLVSTAVPAHAQSRGHTGAAAASAAASADAGSVLGGVLSGMGQGGGSAKAGISSFLGGDAVAKIMPAAGDKHNKRFNKHGKGKNGGASASSLISGSGGAAVSGSAAAASTPAAIPTRSAPGTMSK